MKTKIITFILLCLTGNIFAQNKPTDLCGQLNLIINSSIHKFAEIKSNEKESNIMLEGFTENGYLDLTQKSYVEWGSHDLIFKKKKDMETAFADYVTKVGGCHFDAATLKLKYKLANETEFDAIPTTDAKFKTVHLHIVSGEKTNKKGQFYIYFTVTNDYFENDNTANKEEVEKKKNADDAINQATKDSFKNGLTAILNAAPDSFKAVLGTMHKDMVGTTYDCTAKLPGTVNVFFRDELGARTYNATFYEGFDSVNAENIYNNLFSLVTQSLPAGFKMTDKSKDMNKHLSVFKTDKSGISLTETADKKRSYYNITMMIGDL